MARGQGFLTRVGERADARTTRLPSSLRSRLIAVRAETTSLVQVAVAAGLAWFVAHDLVGHPQPFFAPVAAILVIYGGAGGRWRITVELVVGVSVGVLVGELLIMVIGRGAWQIMVIVFLAVAAATFLGLRGLARTQAATSASLLAAIAPLSSGDPAIGRFIDASVGGLVGLALVLLVPMNPVRRLDSQVKRVLAGLSIALRDIEASLRLGDAGPAWTALQEARGLQPVIESLGGTVDSAAEVARLSPLRWRQRTHVDLYVSAVRDVDNAVRDTRVLARRVHTMLRHGERSPDGMPEAVGLLHRSVGVFADDLSLQYAFDEARSQLIEAARLATTALPSAATINDAAVVAQVRAIASDLLYATGMTQAQVDRALDHG
ncbi:uncharacterized membrane protein YgaE (UPF0421/DUF939 family) [Mumia flava]|uniref:Uncharacterized membrane protein YgaE (UPF0421/DUF939 family) n=1 Tax=Mumia flava TaxID=1348852 RepID=A0A2M9ARF4_9ACTN|nr:FUSC family protein [Mumia flava]PJJ48285.1 uncharacterized membrane protein YgaE (UPF0421/DUF939 family) [Mumia flava]